MLPDDHVIVLFGATGDLAKRKLLPGLFHLARSGPAARRTTGSSARRRKAYAMTRGRVPRSTPRTRSQEFGLAKPTGDDWDRFEDALTFGIADPDDATDLLDKVAGRGEGARAATRAGSITSRSRRPRSRR